MNTVTIEGHLRTEIGKKAARQLRSQDLVPGVIYGGPKDVTFAAPAKAFKPLVYTGEFQYALVKIGEDSYRCIIKDLQFHPVTEKLLHIDLLELVDDKKVVAELPIKFVGTSKGAKEGGKFVVKLKSVKVKTLPKFLKEFVEVDITHLDLNANLRVEDIKIGDFEILNPKRIPIASVVMTRQLRQEEAQAAKDDKKK